MFKQSAAAERALLCDLKDLERNWASSLRVNFNKNYFEIFGLSADYDVDQEVLGDRFLEIQKQVHPDRFAALTEQEKRVAMQWATFVNTANETLRAPLSRAIYLLKLKGVELEHNPVLSPQVLLDQIELRETLEEIEVSKGGLEEIGSFCQVVGDLIDGFQIELREALKTDVGRAEKLVYEFQFLTKLLGSAKILEEKMLDY